jgi:ArsR family transcriptional regulator, virulence genes transcriptional regulator
MRAKTHAPVLDFDPGGYELEADLIRVLANPKRIMIVNLLGQGPGTVTEIAGRLHLSMQNASQHLRVMKDRGIVRAARDGREVRYALTSPVLSECCRLVRQALLSQAQDRATRMGLQREVSLVPNEPRAPESHRVPTPLPING